MKKTVFLGMAAGAFLALTSCSVQKHNALTEAEVAEGWELLFDGQTLNGWRDYNGTELTQPWHVVDGCIQANGDDGDDSR